ncbi:hypothetical protein FJR75_06020 [Thermus thermophilus]|nr:hypothetical protein [Thermus thermophilus]
MACAPRITAEPLPGVRVDVPVQVPPPAPSQPQKPEARGGMSGPVIKVLPGNPLDPGRGGHGNPGPRLHRASAASHLPGARGLLRA